MDLGFTLGAQTNNSLTWTLNGVEFMIASNDLGPEEMIDIARSVQASPVK